MSIWETSWTVFKMFYHDAKWQIARDDVIQTLPQPFLKRSVYMSFLKM